MPNIKGIGHGPNGPRSIVHITFPCKYDMNRWAYVLKNDSDEFFIYLTIGIEHPVCDVKVGEIVRSFVAISFRIVSPFGDCFPFFIFFTSWCIFDGIVRVGVEILLTISVVGIDKNSSSYGQIFCTLFRRQICVVNCFVVQFYGLLKFPLLAYQSDTFFYLIDRLPQVRLQFKNVLGRWGVRIPLKLWSFFHCVCYLCNMR